MKSVLKPRAAKKLHQRSGLLIKAGWRIENDDSGVVFVKDRVPFKVEEYGEVIILNGYSARDIVDLHDEEFAELLNPAFTTGFEEGIPDDLEDFDDGSEWLDYTMH